MNTVSQNPGLFLTVNVAWKDLTLGLPGLFVQP